MVLHGFRWFSECLEGFVLEVTSDAEIPLVFLDPFKALFCLIYINININNNNNNDNNNNGGIAAHCCGIFSCINPLVWPVGGGGAVTAFLVFLHHIIVFHGFSLFF